MQSHYWQTTNQILLWWLSQRLKKMVNFSIICVCHCENKTGWRITTQLEQFKKNNRQITFKLLLFNTILNYIIWCMCLSNWFRGLHKLILTSSSLGVPLIPFRLNNTYIYSTYYTFLASSQLTTSIHWPCYCTAHVYVVIHFCDSMVFLSGTESVHVSFLLLCIAVGNPVIKKGVVGISKVSIIVAQC